LIYVRSGSILALINVHNTNDVAVTYIHVKL
jgi:hypothetical protein